MSFSKQTPRPYNKTDVEKLNKGQIGCYGIYRSGVWIYVGRGDIRQRMIDHLNGDNSCITPQKPTHWVAIVTANSVEMEKELILDLKPTCNKKVG